MKRQYRRRTVCGHNLYVSANGGGGAEWCTTCTAYVAVMISAYEHAVREAEASNIGTAA
jgi:hypothetical protein